MRRGHTDGAEHASVDIIFAVDTTGSMGEEIAFTEENMNALRR